MSDIITSADSAWLGLDDIDSLKIENPLFGRSAEDIKRPDLHLLRKLRHPDHLGTAAKLLLGIELLPVQIVVLRELWSRAFPMFVASRGFGKAVEPNTPIRVKDGWVPIKDLEIGDKVYGSDGKLTNVIMTTRKQTDLKYYKITLRDGRTINCCEDHMWKAWDKNKNRNSKDAVWSELSTKDMVDNYFRVRKARPDSKNKLTKEYRYALPINEAIQEEEKDFLIHPYVVGALLGDGSLTTKTISISSGDIELLRRFSDFLPSGYKLTVKDNSNHFVGTVSREDKSVKPFWKLCKKIGLLGTSSHNKFIPNEYKYGSIEQRLELVKGLMDTDGYSKKSVIEYYTVSNKLSDDFLDVARSLGLHCKHSVKESWLDKKRYSDCHRISIYTKTPIFSLERKLKYVDHPISKQGASKYEKVFITNIEPIENRDGYCIQVDNEDKTYITKDYIVTHNSFLMSVYSMLKCALIPGTKVVIVGAAFRQSKVLFEYMEGIWRNAPILRSICDSNSGPRRDVDRCTMKINDSWTIAVPLGDGQKIRGLRAHTIIADEFASIPPDIYETVVAGFAAVSASPVANVKEAARRKALQKEGLWTEDLESKFTNKRSNQAIISGTADYDFKHFAEYWKRYKGIIESGGDKQKLAQVFNGEFPEGFDWTDYSIVRIPYELIPQGFMDDKNVARAKATIHNGIYQMEYGAVFTADSEGFFKRSLIERCVGSDSEPVQLASGPVWYDAAVRGSKDRQYVYGIDPASEQDNFSIIVIEIHNDHSRIVYSWSTNREKFKKRLKESKKVGLDIEHDFYHYCARKIRELMKVFPAEKIGMDAQGGGIAVEEALHDPDKLMPGEKCLWPVIDPEKSKDTDLEAGLHILELVQFARAEWTAQANHGLRKDFEDQALLFPRFDPITIGLAIENDKRAINAGDKTRLYDSLEDCVMEIEELKDELATIVMSKTAAGNRDKWDTPEVKMPNGRKGRLRKDRYSALLIANMMARSITRAKAQVEYNMIGGTSSMIEKNDGKMYNGPDWYVKGVSQNICRGISRQ
jgi:hypothetical protein